MPISHDLDERNKIIGENLRKYRLLKGLTQDELAEGLCSVSQLSKVENGKTYVKRDILKQMASRLGVTVERIETTDALLEELTDMYTMAHNAVAAKNLAKSMEIVEKLIQQSDEFGYDEMLAKSITLKCKILRQDQRYEEALQVARQALEENLPKNALQKSILLLEMGQCYQSVGNLVAAYDCFYRADDEFENVDGNDMVRLRVNFNLARCHFHLKNYRTAIRHAERAEVSASEQLKHLWRIRSACYKAMALSCLGEYEKAEMIYLRLLKESNENDYLTDVAVISNNIGEMFRLKGQYDEALMYMTKANQVLDLLNHNPYRYEGILQVAEIHFLKGEIQKASEYIDQVLGNQEEKKVSNPKFKAKALQILGGIHASRGDHERFVSLLEQALLIYEQTYAWDEAYLVAIDLADALYERGEARAVDFYRRAVQFNKFLQEMRR